MQKITWRIYFYRDTSGGDPRKQIFRLSDRTCG